MKVTEVHCGFSATINLGNYESFKVDISQTAVLEDGEDPEAAVVELMDSTVKRVKEQVRIRKGDRG